MRYRKAAQSMLLIVLSLVLATFAAAQSDSETPREPQSIQIEAADGAILSGSFYSSPEQPTPTVLLLHELNGSQASWAAHVETLWAMGYQVLTVDLRGHGETGGAQDWEAAVSDVQTWLDWLREQPGVQANGTSIVGADLGGNLAVIGCENDDLCLTAAAISPVGMGCAERDCSAELADVDDAAVAYLDALSVASVTSDGRRSSAVLIASTSDDTSMTSIRHIGRSRSDQVEISATTRPGHGVALLEASGSDILPAIIQRLDALTPAAQTAEEIETLVAAADAASGEVLFAEGLPSAPFEEGKPCELCHAVDSEEDGPYGPGMLNAGERAASRVEGQSAAVYLYNSIVAPDSYVVDGHASGAMPWRYDKGFSEAQIADLIAYLFALKP